MSQLANFLFQKRYHFNRIEFNTVGLFFITVGLFAGSYFIATGGIPQLFAAGTITASWNFIQAGDYTLADTALVEVINNTARLKVQTYNSDTETAALFHFDESSGNTATDSSAYAANASLTDTAFTASNFGNALTLNGSSSYGYVADAAPLSFSQANTLEAWTKFTSSFSAGSHAQRQGIIDKGVYQLYYDNETGKLTYELANASATNWSQVAGNDMNASWDVDGQPNIHAGITIGSDIYVGLGNGVGDAEVWKWNGSTWSKIGGDGINASWAAGTFESVLSLAADGNDVYAGLGVSTGDAEVWKWNGSTWSKIGGDGINASWAVNTYERVYALFHQNSILYAGLGNSAGDAEVWSWNGSTWTKIGGDSINSGWTTNYETVTQLKGDGTNVYVGLALTAGDAEVWRWNGATWVKVGGDAVNSSWADATYEYVLSAVFVGSDLYVGLGTSSDDAEVWRCTGCNSVSPSWTKIGGDSLNSGWATGYEGVYSLATDGTDVYAGLGVSAGDNEIYKYTVASNTWSKIGGDGINAGFGGTTHISVDVLLVAAGNVFGAMTSTNAGRAAEMWQFTGSSWTQIAGNYVNRSWGYRGFQTVESLSTAGGYLYAGMGNAASGNAIVSQSSGGEWNVVGGQGINSSWTANTYEAVTSMTSHDGLLHVGLGSSGNDAEIWRLNGSTWTKIGGDSVNSGWTTNYEEVNSMLSFNGLLYAGLGNSAGDAEVWSWNGSAWTQIGGTASGNWGTANYDRVASMVVYKGALYAGLGLSSGEAEIWRYANGTSWTKIGGDSVNASWDSTNYEQVDSMLTYGNYLIAGLGTGTDDAEVWRYDGNTWTKLGGDDVNGSWTSGTYERVRALSVYNGDLYAGVGNGTGDGELWRYREGSIWTQVGGDSLNASWANGIEEVVSMIPYKGKLYAGLGNTQNADAAIWSYGNNAFLQSTTLGQNTAWHHVAASYDGTTMKLFIDGTEDASVTAAVSLPDTTHDVIIGATYGGGTRGYFNGTIDELRLSNTARSLFITKPFTTAAQTVRPATAVMTSQVKNWSDFIATESAGGGTITYRLSQNQGTTWSFWNGAGWATSSNLTQANAGSVIDANISSFPVGSGGMLWQAILQGDGTQQVTLNNVGIHAVSDTDVPSNPTTFTALNASGGSAITTNTWYNHAAPYFSWNGASDDSGISGYYVYFGTDNTADPVTAGTFQSTTFYSASSMTSGTTYYVRLKAVDTAQNVSSTVYAPFIYKFDSTAPGNPATITVNPAGYASTNSYTFSWPAGSDFSAGIAGYQYKTGTTSGDLSEWSATTALTSVAVAQAAYRSGENTFYLRTVDNAGNVNATSTQVLFYFGGEGPSVPRLLAVSPQTNTVNNFSFSWNPPESFSGNENAITYCYTVNTLPNETTCSFTSPGATSLAAGSFATQVGLNTFYLVARNGADNGGGINYAQYVSVTFTANTSAPGIPLNADIADVSVKSSASWKLALSWESPASSGSGVSAYKIYRSTDGTTFTNIATTTGIAYVDTRLTQVPYFYKVQACDNVNNCGAFSSIVTLQPTGKFTDAAALTSGPTVAGTTTKKATISWTTDRPSDSRIQYGVKSGSYFSEEPSKSMQETDHKIALSNLSPGTTYYYRVRWTDEDGNTGVSSEKMFKTSAAPTITDPKVHEAGLSSVTLSYTVSGASKVKIYYGKTAVFGGIQTTATATSETAYTTELEELEDGTKYYYKMNAVDEEGAEYEGNILSFETLPRPKITNVRLQQVKGTAQSTILVTWKTNTQTTSIVTYYPEGEESEAKDEVNIQRVDGEHRMIIRGLLPQKAYVLRVRGRDQSGNEATSEIQRFTTATDTRPPSVTDVRIEGSIISGKGGQGQIANAQLVVSWDTDEISSSQVELGEGTGTSYSQKTQEDTHLTNNHLVVISGLLPSKVYHLRILSKDKAGNLAQSVDTVTITPKATDDALDLVLTSLSEVFGFLKNR